MRCALLLSLTLLTACGCAHGPVEVCQQLCQNVILPEQRALDLHDADHLPPAIIPALPPPRTVSFPGKAISEWQLSLDDAIRIALENSQVVRVLTGTAATTSGHTIYDAAIVNTTIDQDRARFDPMFSQDNLFGRTNTPTAALNLFDPTRALFSNIPVDSYQSVLGLTKTNVLGGQWSLNWTENPMRFANPGPFPLNPQNPDSVAVSYTQPLLQGAGFAVNTAPIVIDRLNTEVSFFQYKDSVEELVRGVIQAYWTLVQARVAVWTLTQQVLLFQERYDRESALLKSGLGSDVGTRDQALVSLRQFNATLIAAKAAVLTQEGAIRNLLRLPPEDGRQIIPVSPPASQRLEPEWNALLQLAEQRPTRHRGIETDRASRPNAVDPGGRHDPAAAGRRRALSLERIERNHAQRGAIGVRTRSVHRLVDWRELLSSVGAATGTRPGAGCEIDDRSRPGERGSADSPGHSRTGQFRPRPG